MQFLDFLRREADALTSRLILVATAAGLFNGALIAVIIQAAQGKPGEAGQIMLLALFGLCFAGYAVGRKFVMDKTTTIVDTVVAKVRLRLSDRVRRSELRDYEEVGPNSIRTALQQEAQTVSESSLVLVEALSGAVMLVFAFMYVAYLSMISFVVVLGCTSVGAWFYLSSTRGMRVHVTAAMAVEREFFRGVLDLLEGFKELRMDETKSRALFERRVRALADETVKLRLQVAHRFNHYVVFGQCFFYALIGVLIFALPVFVDAEDLQSVEIIAVLLFITGPVGQLVGAVPFVERANVAVENLDSLERALEELPEQPLEPVDRAALPRFGTLECVGATFSYGEDSNGRCFQLGPLDLDIHRGEIVFLIGGNGTGKSTLLKLLSGLYPATTGQIRINGRPVTPSSLAAYRARISIVLQDFHLFDRLYFADDESRAAGVERANELLAEYGIDGVTRVLPDGRFSTINLSSGQRKRLALVTAEIEDREILIFDEVAADQDPSFRRYYYNEFLPALAARGKTILAASHDDHFFHVADRVLKMSDGQLSVYSERKTGGAA